MSIQNYCVEILKVLKSVNEELWSKEFESYIKKTEFLNTGSLSNKIFKLYGGSGSFNDLILYKNGQLCFNENEKLDKLREGLFEELKNCRY